MRNSSSIGLAALLVVLACGGYLLFRQPPGVEEAPPAAAKAAPDAGRGARADAPGGEATGRMAGGIPESAKLHESSVKVELEPDMTVFEGKHPAPDAGTAWEGLTGKDLLSALAGLAQSGEGGLARAWEIVRGEHDPAAKLAVMRAAAAKGGSGVAAILKDGLAAGHPQIRYEAVELLEPMQGREEATRREVLRAAAENADVNVAAAALGQLANDPRKEDLEVMFRFLDHPDEKIASSARGTIDFLIDVEFQGSAEAGAWWQANAGNFDEELSPVE